MPAITARPSTVPPSIEVVFAHLRGNDPTLVAEITDARRRLEEISPEVIALLTEVRQLTERAFDAAASISGDPIGQGWMTGEVGRVREVTGTDELVDAAAKVASAYDAI